MNKQIKWNLHRKRDLTILKDIDRNNVQINTDKQSTHRNPLTLIN